MLADELSEFESDNFEVIDISDTVQEVASTTTSTPGGITCSSEEIFSVS